MITSQLREVTNAPTSEPSHIHIPRPSRRLTPSAAAPLEDEADAFEAIDVEHASTAVVRVAA